MNMGTTRDWRPAFEQQTARINVDDNTWRAFRRLCLDQGEHVSEILGRLVAGEVARGHQPADKPVVIAEPEPVRVDAPTRERDHSQTALSLFD